MFCQNNTDKLQNNLSTIFDKQKGGFIMAFILYLIVIVFGIIYIGFPVLNSIFNIVEWRLNKSIKKVEKDLNANNITNKTNSNKEICFGDWDSEIHWTIAQRDRIMRAKSSNMTPGLVDHTTKTGKFDGSKGTYQTTLNSCTCPDFMTRQLPCKHIYKLAMQLGEMDFNISYNNSHNYDKSNYVNKCNIRTHTINIDLDAIINKAKNSTPEERRASSLLLDFEDNNKKELDCWEKRLENVKMYENPDNTLESYKERVQLAKDFKTFCELKGEGGKLWYQEYYNTDINDAELELYRYENNDYENELTYYKESQRKKKLNAEIKSKILTLAAQENGVLQKDIYEMFNPEDKNTIKNIVEKLVANNIIIKEKQGNFNLLKSRKQ